VFFPPPPKYFGASDTCHSRRHLPVGRTNYLLKTLQFKRICPTQACTTPPMNITEFTMEFTDS